MTSLKCEWSTIRWEELRITIKETLKMKLQKNWRHRAAALGFLVGMVCIPSQAIIEDNRASALFLAQKIAESSGGTVQQYMAYARNLARTLSQFPADKQQEILGIVLGGADDGNNGHGNDPGGIDPSNPGQGKK